MTELYNKQDKDNALKLLRGLIIKHLIALIIVVALLSYITITLIDKYKALAFVINLIISTAMAWYLIIFYSIKFKLTKDYVSMLIDIDEGQKEKIDCTFLTYNDSLEIKDGVEFYTMEVSIDNETDKSLKTRKIYIDKDKPKIDLKENSKLKISTHANILLSYKIR